MPFSFTLDKAATTSAGVFSKEGALIKTLWSGVKYAAGPHTQTWDGLNDEGNLTADGSYTVKVVASNVTYEWEGVIGNTSQAKTGSSVNRSAHFMTNMVVVGNFAYYAVAYTEGDAASYLKFDINNPQVRLKIHPHDGQSTYVLASDGTYVYWGGAKDGTTNFVAATKVTDDTDVAFPAGETIEAGNHRYSAIDVVNNSQISGMAVQKTGNYLFVAHASSNQIRVLNKRTGAFLRNWSVTNPKQLALSDDNTLWVIHDGTIVEKFTLDNLGAGTATGATLPNILAPVALAVSPNGQTIAAIDGSLDNRVTTAGNHQVKAYSTSSATPAWTLGQAGGYANDPTVQDDKFCFIDTKSFEGTDTGQAQPYLAFQPDGSFWVGDLGNLRSQHFSAARTYLNQVAYIGYFYSCVVDPNAPKRVFANYLEFEVDYAKPLSPSNGSWRLVKNWSYGRKVKYDNPYNRLQCLTTLRNGRTYALVFDSSQRQEVIELPPTGNIRYTGYVAPSPGVYQLFSDGSLWGLGDNRIGQPAVWTKQVLTGFDSSNTPIWGPKTVAATTPPVTQTDPVTIDGHLKRNQVTSTGVVVAFCSDRPNGPAARGNGYHLGGVQEGTNNWLWKTSPSTTQNYRGDFPTDGAYDVGNGVEYAGNFAQAIDRNIFWGYQGEFWKNAQTNKWNHYLDNGLLVGQFGVVRRSDMASEEAQYGLASNAVTGTFVKVGSDYYLYHCDEGFHAGIHRWKISGLNTIQEQTAATLTLTGTAGLVRQQFKGGDLNNVNLTSSVVATTVKEASQVNSIRWAGFISPANTQTYTFYAAASKKVRLWVDGKLLIDQWNNTAPEEFTSSSVALEAGKKYAIRMEINEGSASLSWSSATQSKEIVPAASFYTAAITDSAASIPLNEGLTFNSSVTTELYGWSRSPALDYANPTDWWNKWLVQTNITNVNKTNPDINVQFRPPSDGLTATVSRNLSDGTTALNKWSITGKLMYPASDFDKKKGTGYFQVLDENGKVIARIYRQEVSWPIDYRFYLNDKVVIQASIDSLYLLGKKAQPFTLTATSSGIMVQYAGLPAVTAAPLDPSSNWQHPKTLQVLFYSPGQDEHELNMADLRFSASTMPALPILLADDDQNTLNAWQSTPTREIMVSEAAKDFAPYSGQIVVGNVAREAGHWKFKLRDVAEQQEGLAVESPAFTATSPLPLKLITLTASKAGGQANVNWRTSNEVNTQSFVVEKSADNLQFTSVGTVPAGNATGTYSLSDKHLLTGVTYYRLKMIDMDASFTYSPVVSVSGEVLELALYPNPTQHFLHVRYPLNASSYLEVMTVTGKWVMHTELAPSSTDAALDVQALPPGLYYLQYKSGSYTAQKLFTKQ